MKQLDIELQHVKILFPEFDDSPQLNTIFIPHYKYGNIELSIITFWDTNQHIGVYNITGLQNSYIRKAI